MRRARPLTLGLAAVLAIGTLAALTAVRLVEPAEPPNGWGRAGPTSSAQFLIQGAAGPPG